MNIRSLFEAVFLRDYKSKTRHVSNEAQDRRKEKSEKRAPVQLEQLAKEKKAFTELIANMSVENQRLFHRLLYQQGSILVDELFKGQPLLPKEKEGVPIVDVLKLLNLTTEQCRAVDKSATNKSLYLHRLFFNILQDSEQRKHLKYLLIKYNQDLYNILFKDEDIDFILVSEMDAINKLRLTDEQICVIEKITNISKSKIKLKTDFYGRFLNHVGDDLKWQFQNFLHAINPELEEILYRDDPGYAYEEPYLMGSKKADQLFDGLNNHYHYFSVDYNKKIFLDVFHAVYLTITYLENPILLPDGTYKEYSEEEIALTAYKIMALFTDHKTNSALDILKNVEKYINMHNFKNMPIADVFNFDLPQNKCILYNKIIMLNEHAASPSYVAEGELMVQCAEKPNSVGIVTVYWNKNGKVESASLDGGKVNIKSIVDRLKKVEKFSNNVELIKDVMLAFNCPAMPLMKSTIAAWNKLILQYGGKVVKLLQHAGKVERLLSRGDNFNIYLMQSSENKDFKVSNNEHVFLYKVPGKAGDIICYFIKVGDTVKRMTLSDKLTNDEIKALNHAGFNQTVFTLTPYKKIAVQERIYAILREHSHVKTIFDKYAASEISSDEFLEKIYESLAKDKYGARYHEDKELAVLFFKSNKSVVSFNFALDIQEKQKKTDCLPVVSIDCGDTALDAKLDYPGYYLVKVPIGDKRAFLLGDMTNCCQRLEGHAEQCVVDGVTSEYNGFYVLLKNTAAKDKKQPIVNGKIDWDNYKLVGQGYAWMSAGGKLEFDSWESLKTEQEKNMQEQRWEMPLIDKVATVALQAFSKLIPKKNSIITGVNIGTGGETPLYFKGVKKIFVIIESHQNEFTARPEFKSQLTKGPLLIISAHDNNKTTFYRLNQQGEVEKHHLKYVDHSWSIDDNGEEVLFSNIPDELYVELKSIVGDDLRRQVALAPRELMVTGFQYGDSLEQVSIYEDTWALNDTIVDLYKKIDIPNLANLSPIYYCLSMLISDIPSKYVLDTIDELLYGNKLIDWGQEPYSLLFAGLQDADRANKAIELFYCIAYLHNNECLNEASVNSLLKADIDFKESFTNRAILFKEISGMGLSIESQNKLVDAFDAFNDDNITRIVRIMQALKYARVRVDDTYRTYNLLTEDNLTVILQMLNKLSDGESIMFFEECICIMQDAKLLTNDFLLFLEDGMAGLEQDDAKKFIQELYEKILHDFFFMDAQHKDIELFCIAAARSDIALMDYLIEQGVDINASSAIGATAIYYAIGYYQNAAFDYLVQKGAFFDMALDVGNAKNLTPIMQAINNLNFYAFTKLIDLGMDFDIDNDAIWPFYQEAIKEKNFAIVELCLKKVPHYDLVPILNNVSSEFLKGTCARVLMMLFRSDMLDSLSAKYVSELSGASILHGIDLLLSSSYDKDDVNTLLDPLSQSEAGIEFLLAFIYKHNDKELARVLLEKHNTFFAEIIKEEAAKNRLQTWIIENGYNDLGELLGSRFIQEASHSYPLQSVSIFKNRPSHTAGGGDYAEAVKKFNQAIDDCVAVMKGALGDYNLKELCLEIKKHSPIAAIIIENMRTDSAEQKDPREKAMQMFEAICANDANLHDLKDSYPEVLQAIDNFRRDIDTIRLRYGI